MLPPQTKTLCLMLSLFFVGMKAHAENLIQIRLAGEVPTMDWQLASTGSEGAVLQNIMEGLMQLDSSMNSVPSLAESYTSNDNGLSYTFKLRHEVLWSDGKPFTADDVKNSIHRLLSPELSSKNAELLFPIKGAREYYYGRAKTFDSVGVKILNPHEIQFLLQSPYSAFPLIFAHWATFPVRAGISPGAKSPTLGAYKIESFNKRVIRLKANPLYWNAKKITFSRVIFRVIESGKQALDAFKKGRLDFLINLEDELIDQGRALGKVEFVQPTHVSAILLLNPNQESLSSASKRRGFFRLLDTSTLLGPQFPTREKAFALVPYAPEFARPDFKGFLPNDKDHFDLPPKIMTIAASDDDSISQEIAKTLIAQMNAIEPDRAKIEIIRLQPDPIYNFTTLRRIDAFVKVFGLVFMDPDQMYGSFLYQGLNDFFGWSNPEFTRVLTDARGKIDLRERWKLYARADDILENDGAIAFPLFMRNRAYLLSKKIVENGTEPKGSPNVLSLGVSK